MATPEATQVSADAEIPELVVGCVRFVFITLHKEPYEHSCAWRGRWEEDESGERIVIELPDAILHLVAAAVSEGQSPRAKLELQDAEGAGFVKNKNPKVFTGNAKYTKAGASTTRTVPFHSSIQFAAKKDAGSRKEALLRIECGDEAAEVLLRVNSDLKGKKAADPGHRATADELAVVARANASLYDVAVTKPGQVEAVAARHARQALLLAAAAAPSPHKYSLDDFPGTVYYMLEDPANGCTYHVARLPGLIRTASSGSEEAASTSSSPRPALVPDTPRASAPSEQPRARGHQRAKRSRAARAAEEEGEEGEEEDKENAAPVAASACMERAASKTPRTAGKTPRSTSTSPRPAGKAPPPPPPPTRRAALGEISANPVSTPSSFR
eukprot:tig00000545_g2021.t1